MGGGLQKAVHLHFSSFLLPTKCTPKALLLAAAVLPRGRGHVMLKCGASGRFASEALFSASGAWSQVPCCVHDFYQNQHQKGQADHDSCVYTVSMLVQASAVAKLAAKISRFLHPHVSLLP